MKGLWLENCHLRLRDDLPMPRPQGDEALIRVLQAGICNTDLEMARGYYPFAGIPGHEFVGVVEKGPSALEGERVVGEINVSCGACPECERGRQRHCANRTVLGIRGRNGAFAEFLTLPVANLHPIPASMPTDVATFVEPLAAALRIQEQLAIEAGSRVLVVGCGKLGRLIAQTLSLTGCHLEIVARRRQRISLPERRSIEVRTAAEPQPRSFDIAVECTGDAQGFEIARRALRPRGQLVLKSTFAGRPQIDTSALVVDEITLIGSRCGPFAPALELLGQRLLDIESLIASRYPLAHGVLAFEAARRPGTLKILLEVDNSPR